LKTNSNTHSIPGPEAVRRPAGKGAVLALMLALLSLAALLILLPVCTSAEDVTPEVPIVTKVMTGIRVTTLPKKTQYFTSEDLVITGAKLTIDYSDGTHQEVDIKSEWCSGFESYTAGKVTVYVKYPDWSDPATFEVTVVLPTVSYITLKKKPDTTDYYTGQKLDPMGIIVMATYNNGFTEDVSSDVSYSDVDFSVPAAKKTVTLTYKSDGKKFTASFDITITQRAPASLRVSSQPEKLSYYDGESFDRTGIAVMVKYNDGSEEAAEDGEIEITGFDSSVIGQQLLVVTCRGLSTNIIAEITVSPDHTHTPGERTRVLEPTCTEQGKEEIKCTVCGSVVEEFTVDATGHSFGEWIIDQTPALGVPGAYARICSVCSDKETEPIPALERTLSDKNGDVIFTLEGDGKECFPSGSELSRTDIAPILTIGESMAYDELAKTVSAIVLDISLVRYKAGVFSETPSTGVFVTYKFNDGAWKSYHVFVNGQEVVSDYRKDDGTLRFVLSSGWSGDLTIMVAGVPDRDTTAAETTAEPPVTTEAETTSAGVPGETSVIAGEEATTSAEPEETTAPDDKYHESEEETTGAVEDNGMTREEFGKTFAAIGIVIAGIMVLALIIAFIYKRVIY